MEVVGAVLVLAFLFLAMKSIFSHSRSAKAPGVEEWHHIGLIRNRYETEATDSGFVYFVRESGNRRIKIGKAKDPDKRIQNDFGTIMPYEFDVVHLINSSNYHKTEQLFHHYFHHKRYKGEWFDLTEADLDWVKRGIFSREIDDSIKGY